MSTKIGLDAGHGLKTAGKQTPDGIKEWTLNDKVCDKVQAYLADYDCTIIRTDNNEGNTDEGLSTRRTTYINQNVSAFVSVHHNAFTGNWNNATGVEVYTDKNPISGDVRLAECIYSRLVANTQMKGRGIKQANWAVINQNAIPAVLCEGGFMDGTNDYKYITSDAGQTAYAKAVAEGLVEFLGLQKKTVSQPATNTSPSASSSATVPFLIKVANVSAGDVLNVRKEPNANATKTGALAYNDPNTYTIVETKNGWGRLKSGIGWINLKYTKTVSGTATTQTKPVESVSYYPAFNSTSIVDGLKSIGVDSSKANRTKIAKANGISNYSGTAFENTKLLALARQGQLKKV